MPWQNLGLKSIVMPCPSATGGLNLCEAAIHKQLRSRDEAAVVGCKKHYGLRDLIGGTEPAEWNAVRNHLLALLARFCGRQQLIQSGRIGRAWAHCVHANVAIPQVRCPGPRERPDGGFCGAINTIRRQPFTGDDGGIQDDRGPIRQQRKRLLYREQEAFYVDVEDGVVEVLSYPAKRGVPRNTGVREHDNKLALLQLDLCDEAIEIGKVRHVALYTGRTRLP